MLATVSDILVELHSEYYRAVDQGQPQATSDILRQLQAKYRYYPPWCLGGVCILFSSVIPQHTKPSSHEYWQRAESMGARCVTEFSAEVTHVVARVPGTEKVYEAQRRPNVFLVHLSWLERCFAQCTRVDEHQFPLSDGHPRVKHFTAESRPRTLTAGYRKEADQSAVADTEEQLTNMEMDVITFVPLSADQLTAMTAEVDAELADASGSSEDEEAQEGEKHANVALENTKKDMSHGPATVVGQKDLNEWARLARKRKVGWLDQSSDSDSSGRLDVGKKSLVADLSSESDGDTGSDVSFSFVQDIENAI